MISRTSAKILTKVLGDNFEFLDTTEEKYGLKARNYKSFIEAADEAAISRIWGGIHYMPAITLGIKQGDKVAVSDYSWPASSNVIEEINYIICLCI